MQLLLLLLLTPTTTAITINTTITTTTTTTSTANTIACIAYKPPGRRKTMLRLDIDETKVNAR